MKEKEQETQVDLSDRLRSLIQTKAQGVQGLDELIEGTITQIMEKAGVKPETKDKFIKGVN